MKTPADRTVLITGGAGFIGSVVAGQALARGWSVRILDNFSRSDRHGVEALVTKGRVSLIEGDVRNRQAVEDATAGVDGVVHLAAVCINQSLADPIGCFDVNVRGSRCVFESAARLGVPRVVFASSASVYGEAQHLPTDEDEPLRPLTPYCESKVAGEEALRSCASDTDLAWLALRFFNVYGPGQPTDAFYTSVIVTFLRRIAAGEPVVLDGDGTQTMDFVHVDDVARAVMMALESDASNQVLNVGTGTQTSVVSLARALADRLGVPSVCDFRPGQPLVHRRQAAIDRIGQVLGWAPSIGLAEGLATVIDHLESTPAAT